MAEVLKLFKTLSQFYVPCLTVEQVSDIFEKAENNSESSSEDGGDADSSDGDDTESSSSVSDIFENLPTISVENIPIVVRAVEDPQVLSVLLELCTTITNLRESTSGYDNTFDCWDRVIEFSPQEHFLTFIYTLLKLAQHNPTSKIYRKISMATARAYFLSLTIPGSKGFHIFDEQMIENAIEVFDLIDLIQNENIAKSISKQDRIEIWVNFSNLCDDLKIMFRYVHFDEYKDVRNSILWQLNKLLYNNHVNGYENIYAANLHSKCFEIYEEAINAHNGDPEDTLMKIMKISYCLHVFPPTPKHKENFTVNTTNTQFCQHISDWFILIINKYPRIVPKVLKHFIECVITNPEKDWRGEQLQRVFDYAAKYDAALYTKCNESILSFLSDSSNADDIQIRSNSIELLNRMILIESKVNWEVFRHEISNISREIYIIKTLIERLLDVNNSIKLKSLNGLHQAFLKGTPDAIQILTECIKFTQFDDDPNIDLPIEPRVRFGEIRYEKPKLIEPNYTFIGHDLITSYFTKLPNILYHLYRNQLAFVRRAALLLIEEIVAINPSIIYHTRFVKESSKMGDDSSPLVRKQALLMIDSILSKYSNCYPIIYTWCKIIVPLFKDSDHKIVDQAWECFKRRVFDNIKGIDKSNMAEHFMPWIIVRNLLSTQSRQFLQSSIQFAINRKCLDQKTLSVIESHTLTANSTEAWTMLSFAAGKIKIKEPDSLISAFIKSMLEQSWNAGQNLQIILEVLAICVNDFSHPSLNMAFTCIINLMKNGNIPPNLVSKAFNFCQTINGKSENNNNQKIAKTKMNRINQKWIEDIHEISEKYLEDNIKNFANSSSLIISYLFIYTETNLELLVRPKTYIINFVHKYLENYIDSPENHFETENITILNQMITIAGRLSIRDSAVTGVTCLLYRLILKKTERPTTINNVIVCMTDLCKRHTQIIEWGLNEVLLKLKSNYLEIRLVTFRNLIQIILQDLIKLRGNILLILMTTLLDKNLEIANRATEFFLTYLEKKNSSLFQTCLLECPFVYNGYMNFEGFESFTPSEMKMESPLKGDEYLKERHKLYKIFMLEHEEVILLMFFRNLKMLNEQINKEPAIKSIEGYSMIKDMLFIFKEICIISTEKNDTKSRTENNPSEDDIIESMVGTSAMNGSANETNIKDKRKNDQPTMNDAMALIEKMICLIPNISNTILEWDESFKKPIDDLCIAVCVRFENLTEFAQPQEFWTEYRKISKQTSILINRKRKNQDPQNSDESDQENDGNQVGNSKNMQISLLFKPFLT